ncbi:MAG: DUF4340 domain-containing protein [Ruminococcus sp.]|jgi:hypothetical protein|nr:DUF4340 domain-containing protein [Ruminococcus sp.]
MKKPIIIAIILFILAAASCTAFYFVKQAQDEKNSSQSSKLNSYKLFNFDSSTVKKVSISCADGDFSFSYNDSKWSVDNVDDYPLNQDYLTNVCTYMSTLTAATDYGKANDSKKASYGLDKPIKITCDNGSDKFTIYVGKMTPSADYYYVMVEGNDTVFAVDALNGSVLNASESLFKSNKLVTCSDSDVQSFNISRGDQEILDVQIDSNDLWAFSQDKYKILSLDNTKVATAISVITRLEAEKFITANLPKNEYSKYGFDKPYAQLTVKSKSGNSTHLLFSYFGDDADKYTYVLNTDSGQVGTFYTSDVDFIEKNVGDFLVDTVQQEDIGKASKLDLNYNGKLISFNIDSDKTQYDVNGTDIDALGNDALGFFYNFYTALGSIKFSSVDVDAVPSGEPSITADYTYKDGSHKTMQFIKSDDTNYWLMINGKYSGYIIRENYITGTSAFMYWYNKLDSFIAQSTT